MSILKKIYYDLFGRSERKLELDIIRNYLDDKKLTLEIGNVLSHYMDINHIVIDKYEKAPNVYNMDAMDIEYKNFFDLIISISTLEHIGFDEKEKNPKKVIEVIKKLRKALKKGGKFIATIPMGYNHYIDGDIINNRLGFDEMFFFKRLKNGNWKLLYKAPYNFQYNYPFKYANVLMVGEINV